VILKNYFTSNYHYHQSITLLMHTSERACIETSKQNNKYTSLKKQ